MSGRIRTVKPEWLEDEVLALASSDTRVLSIALMLLADDHGRGRANRLILAGQVFPGKPRETLAKALEELRVSRYVTIYEVEGQSYFEIRNWFKHQRVDHPSKGKVPAPPVDSSGITANVNEPREALGNPREGVDDTRASRDPFPSLPGLGPDPDARPSRRPRRTTKPPAVEVELPDDWKPTAEHAERAARDQLNLQREVDRFRAKAKEKATTAVSWNGKFTTWLINAVEFRERDGRAPTGPAPKQTTEEQRRASAAAAEARAEAQMLARSSGVHKRATGHPDATAGHS